MKRSDVSFSVLDVAAQISRMLDKHVDTEFVFSVLRDIDPPDGGRYPRTKKISGDQARVIVSYSTEWHGRRNRPGIIDWMAAHNVQKPLPFVEPEERAVANVTQPKKQKPKQTVNLGSIEREIKALRFEIEKMKSASRDDVKQIVSAPQKQRDEDTAPFNKAISKFVFDHDISASKAWAQVEMLLEQRNGIDINRQHGQSLPQWLRHEGLLSVAMSQLPGILDQMHDAITLQPELKL